MKTVKRIHMTNQPLLNDDDREDKGPFQDHHFLQKDITLPAIDYIKISITQKYIKLISVETVYLLYL